MPTSILRELAIARGESLVRGERAFSLPRPLNKTKPRTGGGVQGFWVPVGEPWMRGHPTDGGNIRYSDIGCSRPSSIASRQLFGSSLSLLALGLFIITPNTREGDTRKRCSINELLSRCIANQRQTGKRKAPRCQSGLSTWRRNAYGDADGRHPAYPDY
jgi:hypothetical protein